MNTVLLITTLALGLLVLFLGFLAWGALRAMGLLSWRVAQLEATTPRRAGRDGLPVGRRAPEFTSPSAAGGEVSLRGFAGRKVLLVFTQSGCGPCHDIIPELSRVQRGGEHQVIVVNNGTADEAREMAAEGVVEFPILVQEHFELSKRYEVYATPFAFAIDEGGTIAAKGLVGMGQHLGYVISAAGDYAKKQHIAARRNSAVEGSASAAGPLTEASHA
jgi:methylamine dehydrogenase accessory protein MauD